MSTIEALLIEDRHSADPGLDPLRFCVRKWSWLCNAENQGCTRLLRVVQAAALLVLSFFCALIASLAYLIKKCAPIDYFTPREALLKNSQLQLPFQTAVVLVKCDLRSGTLVCKTNNGWFYWEPGLSDVYHPLQIQFPTPRGSRFTSDGDIIGAQMRRLSDLLLQNPALTEGQAQKIIGTIPRTQASFAPILGVIVLCESVTGVLLPVKKYKTLDMPGFLPLPDKTIWISTGGKINPDGTVVNETLIRLAFH